MFQDLAKQHNVVVLVEFAMALMVILSKINDDSFQKFQLRIGKYILAVGRHYYLNE